MQVHPQQLSPSETADIFYFLRNPTDSTTYYVRAVIYDVRTGTVLQTLNLDQSGANSHLFVKTFQAPADPVGIGRNIVAIASVYTDSGYTTKSPDYEEQEQYFLIKAVLPMTGGGSIDQGAFRDMIGEAIDKKLGSLPAPEPAPPVPYDALFGAIGALQREINRVPKELGDDQAVLVALATLKAQIARLPPPPPPADFSPLLERLTQIFAGLQALRKDNASAAVVALNEHKQEMQEIGTGVLAAVEQGMKEFVDKQQVTIPMSKLFSSATSTPEPALPTHLM